jgi:hypothetical protein
MPRSASITIEDDNLCSALIATARSAARCLSWRAFDRADAGYWPTNRTEARGERDSGSSGPCRRVRFDRRAESERREIPHCVERVALWRYKTKGAPECALQRIPIGEAVSCRRRVRARPRRGACPR